MDTENGTAWVRDEDGEEVEVSIERLDNIEEPVLDTTPLELPFQEHSYNIGMTSTTTKSLSQLDQEFSNTLKEYNIAKIAKQCGKDVENLLEVLKLALERIDTELQIAINKHDDEFPFSPKGVDE